MKVEIRKEDHKFTIKDEFNMMDLTALTIEEAIKKVVEKFPGDTMDYRVVAFYIQTKKNE